MRDKYMVTTAAYWKLNMAYQAVSHHPWSSTWFKLLSVYK